MRVTQFEPRFTDELVRMWRESFEFGVGVVDPHPIEEQVAYFLGQVVPNNKVRAAWAQDELVAFLASTAESITLLHVKVSHLGRGIGTQLLRLAQTESSGRLWLFTFKQNERACRFYEHHGFAVAARGFEPSWQLEDVKYVWARQESITGEQAAPARSPSREPPTCARQGRRGRGCT